MFFKQMKGEPERLDGRLTAYCRVELDSPPDEHRQPLAGMIHNHWISVRADYREDKPFSQIFKKEMGENIRAGMEDLLEKLGIENAGENIDLDKISKHLESMKEIGEYIPTPARFTELDSLEAIMEQAGDVFDLGIFQNLSNANFCLNALPILYQAKYREQKNQEIRKEINTLLESISTYSVNQEPNWRDDPENVQQNLMVKYIPAIFYAANDAVATQNASQKLRSYLDGYRFTEDVDLILSLVQRKDLEHGRFNMLLELLIKKISAVIREDFSAAAEYQHKIKDLTRDF
jgi:hypothetical protein